jgi:inner membrane protein
MDPLTQGVLGAALPQATAARGKLAAGAGVLGFLAGMAADLDVLIRSSNDPLLFLEYHRQFTHSLVFIPAGGLLCALVLHGLLGRRRGLRFRQSWLFCTLGYATHALLDACTTYGTMLFWPFSDARVAWNTISIIDPLFTLPLLLAVVFAGRRGRPLFARLGLLWACGYMALGLWQRNEAVDMGYALAANRGHQPLRLEAKPSFANILVWKTVYETDERYYVDAVRAGLAPRVFVGNSVKKLDIPRDLPWLDRDSQQARDVERFRWFSNGYIARDPKYPDRVIDIRYSIVPNELAPLWSIELRRGARVDEHAHYLVHRDAGGNRAALMWRMLSGG